MKPGAVLPAVVTVAFLAGLAPADAAVIKKWSINAGVLAGLEKVDEDSGRKDTTITGARLGLAVLPSITIEAVYDTFETDPDGDDDLQGVVTSDYTGLRVVGTFFAEEDKRSLPYVAAGGGRVEQEYEPDDGGDTVTDDSPYFELGFGARVFVWRTLNVRGELGFRHARVLDVTQTNVHFSVTASILFGGKE